MENIIYEFKNEIYKDLPLYENEYMVSNYGNIYDKLNNKNIKIYVSKKGYKQVVLKKADYRRNFCVQKLVAICFLNHSFDSKMDIHHIDDNPSNNYVDNLQIVTRRRNTQEWAKNHKSTSKYIGVSWHPFYKKWRSMISKKGIQYFLGFFDNENKAHQAYLNAEQILENGGTLDVKYVKDYI